MSEVSGWPKGGKISFFAPIPGVRVDLVQSVQGA